MLKIIILSLLTTQVFANIMKFETPMQESTWKVNKSPFQCELAHDIKGYGELIFSQESGQTEVATLNIYDKRGIVNTRAFLDYVSPPWQPEEKVTGFKFEFPKDFSIEFSARQTKTMLDKLHNGLVPTIFHSDNNDRRTFISANVNLINFNVSYQEYLACRAQMNPYSFVDIKNSDILFDTGSARIDRKGMRLLNYILQYANDEYLRRIEILGYTDSVGSFRANHKLASRRVEVVQNFFKEKGIDPKLIKLKVYGEQRAVYDNRTKFGRMKNRRVQVKIYR